MSGEKIIDGAEVGRRLAAMINDPKFIAFIHEKDLILYPSHYHAFEYCLTINVTQAVTLMNEYVGALGGETNE